MPEVPAVLVVGFLSDPVDHFQCLEKAAVAAREETVELVAVVQVLPEEQEEVHEVPWEHPCGRWNPHPRVESWSISSLPLPCQSKQAVRLMQSACVSALHSSSTSEGTGFQEIHSAMLQEAHHEELYDAESADKEKLFAGVCQTGSNISFSTGLLSSWRCPAHAREAKNQSCSS